MKKLMKEKRSLTTGNRAGQVRCKSNPVRGSCGKFSNLPPPEEEGG